MDRPLIDRMKPALFWALFAVLCLHFVELMSEVFSTNFKMDALLHHLQVLNAESFDRLLRNLRLELQPVLDYALRKYFWYPILGTNERGIRIPDMAAALGLLSFSTTALYRWALKSGVPVVLSGFVALGYGFWVVQQPVFVSLLAESRHYELTALMSVVWCYLHFLREDRDWLYYAATVLFANTHFFGLPFIATAALWETWLRARQGRAFEAARHLAVFAVGLGVVLWLNWIALSTLVAGGWDRYAPLRSVSPFVAAKQVYLRWFTEFSLPLGFVLPAAALVSLKGRPRRWALFFVLFVTFPLFAFTVRLRTQYEFYPRYYMAFFGWTLVLYAWGSETLYRGGALVWKKVEARWPELAQRRWGVEGVVAVAVLASPATWDFVGRVRRGMPRLHVPPPNFTEFYEDYSRVRQDDPYVFIVDGPLHRQIEIGGFYLERSKLRQGRVLAKWSAWLKQTSGIPAEKIDSALRASPTKVVLFEVRRRSGQACPEDLSTRLAGLRLRDFGARHSCLFSVQGIETLKEAAAVLARAGLPMEWL